MHFGSDNMVGASEPVLHGLVRANAGEQPSYGADAWCQQAEQALAATFETELRAFFVNTGTVSNSLALAALVEPWAGVLCQNDAHILADESTAPEFFTGGARLIPIAPVRGKLTVATLEAAIVEGHPPHNVRPTAVSITQVNERGLVYTAQEIGALTAAAHRHGMKVHMDGARFANAVAALDCPPADLTWRAGVDVLCLGASKNGALMAEAIIFFDLALARDFEYRVKRAGQMAAKSRIYGAQFTAWLEHGHWLELAQHANMIAQRLHEGLAGLPGVRCVWPVQANEVFAIMPKALAARLREQGAVFYDWPARTLPARQRLSDDECYVRFVASFANTRGDVNALLTAARR